MKENGAYRNKANTWRKGEADPILGMRRCGIGGSDRGSSRLRNSSDSCSILCEDSSMASALRSSRVTRSTGNEITTMWVTRMEQKCKMYNPKVNEKNFTERLESLLYELSKVKLLLKKKLSNPKS